MARKTQSWMKIPILMSAKRPTMATPKSQTFKLLLRDLVSHSAVFVSSLIVLVKSLALKKVDAHSSLIID